MEHYAVLIVWNMPESCQFEHVFVFSYKRSGFYISLHMFDLSFKLSDFRQSNISVHMSLMLIQMWMD